MDDNIYYKLTLQFYRLPLKSVIFLKKDGFWLAVDVFIVLLISSPSL